MPPNKSRSLSNGKTSTKEDGEFDLHKEGATRNSSSTINDNTVQRYRPASLKLASNTNITKLTDHYAVEIITQHHQGIIVTATPRHQVLRCLCAERSDGRGGYLPFQSHHRVATGGLRKPFTAIPPTRWWPRETALPWSTVPGSSERHGIHPVPSHSPFHPGDRPRSSSPKPCAVMAACCAYQRRKRIHAEVRPATLTGPARHRGAMPSTTK